jgi:hypothetical protein
LTAARAMVGALASSGLPGRHSGVAPQGPGLAARHRR